MAGYCQWRAHIEHAQPAVKMCRRIDGLNHRRPRANELGERNNACVPFN